MKIDSKKLDEFLETHIRPLWNDKEMEYPYREGGGEAYLHDKVLAKAHPLMNLESIKKDPKGSLLGALKAHDNLLSQFEWSWAKDFLQNISDEELFKHLLPLFDESNNYSERLHRFLEWSIERFQDSTNKMEINPTVCSYFLAMHNPVQYAFCKPMTYQALAKLLIVDEEPVNEPVQRIIQCTDFYKVVLHDLEKRYGLQNGNLLDVHSLAYTYKALSSNADPQPSSNTKEKQLIEKIRQSGDYKEFKEIQLKPKIDRERRAWELLEKHRGAYTQEALNEIFDAVDLNPSNVRWFGSLVAQPNRNLIFASSIDELNDWFEKLLFSNLPVEKALDDCLGEGKIKGARNGLATLLLYLKKPDENVIWLPATEKGLATLERLKPAKAVSVGQRYLSFREEAIDFREQHQIGEQELDWYLSYISKHFGTTYPDFVKQKQSLVDSTPPPTDPLPVYDKDKELNDLFLDEAKFNRIIDILKSKKNIVLQGPPGVGKTFIARHLAYALIDLIDKDRVAMIQFHQSYSYEDFMQGFRPNSEGRFDLKNGVFYEFCRKAQRNPANPHVFIIDEINRGNLSKIFGEMLMLVERDKRGPDFAMPLTYAQNLEDTFYIPDNVYIIGTMNTADRSLAMVDYALRRRFGFITLNPGFENEKFKKYLTGHGVENAIVDKVIDRMVQLNTRIAEDHKNLGRGYCIGHSYFCPVDNNQVYDGTWYKNVVCTEIEPLLEEYWFDDPDKVQKRVELLLA